MRKTSSSLFIEDELRIKLEQVEMENLDLITERNEALEDLRNVENAFADLHKKYERVRVLLENFKKNENILKERDQQMMEKISNRDLKIDEMKDKLQKTLERMHVDYEVRIKEAEAENAKLRVLVRKTEMKVEKLENDVDQKDREIGKLSSLIDELVSGKMGQDKF